MFGLVEDCGNAALFIESGKRDFDAVHKRAPNSSNGGAPKIGKNLTLPWWRRKEVEHISRVRFSGIYGDTEHMLIHSSFRKRKSAPTKLIFPLSPHL
jgi:hypothetical protein